MIHEILKCGRHFSLFLRPLNQTLLTQCTLEYFSDFCLQPREIVTWPCMAVTLFDSHHPPAICAKHFKLIESFQKFQLVG